MEVVVLTYRNVLPYDKASQADITYRIGIGKLSGRMRAAQENRLLTLSIIIIGFDQSISVLTSRL